MFVKQQSMEKSEREGFSKGKELYRNGGKDLFTFSAVNLGWMAESKSRGLSVLSRLATNKPADLVEDST